MAKGKRRYGTGRVYIKHGFYYGTCWTPSGGRANRKIGTARARRRSDASGS